jgi:hypothetical protein
LQKLADPNACVRPIKPINKSNIIDGETGKELAALQHGSKLLFAYSSIGGDKQMDDEPIELNCERCGASIIRYPEQNDPYCLMCTKRKQEGN